MLRDQPLGSEHVQTHALAGRAQVVVHLLVGLWMERFREKIQVIAQYLECFFNVVKLIVTFLKFQNSYKKKERIES